MTEPTPDLAEQLRQLQEKYHELATYTYGRLTERVDTLKDRLDNFRIGHMR